MTRVLVVGSGWEFTSGISYYTCRLTNALAEVTPTDAVLMRRLVPKALYPGRARVGVPVNDVDYAPGVDVYNGVDWYWGRTIGEARRFIVEHRPDVVVLQWWTGAVLHSYLNLAGLARRHGAKVVVEWHEVQDVGEARIPGVTAYVKAAMGALLRRTDAHVVHSRYDLDLLQRAYGLDATEGGNLALVPHGPYDHVGWTDGDEPPTKKDPDAPFVVLYFGVIRPFKGVEDLVAAFDRLPREQQERMELRVVGEPWEGWSAPVDAIAASPARDRITFVDRYVSDAEARRHFAEADAVVLPYRRSSASGPLHMAMSAGLPVVVTAVGGLVDAAGDYEGTRFVPPADVDALTEALRELPARRNAPGQRYADPHSWDTTVETYRGIFARLGLPVWQPAAQPQPSPADA